MAISEQRICDVVATSPEAEDILEDAGIDYWFGWERMLGAACAAANVDTDVLAGRLSSCRPCAISEPPSSLAKLLRESEDQWKVTLAPAIRTALISAAALHGGREDVASQRLHALEAALAKHMETSRTLLLAAEAIEQGRAGSVDRETIRSLRLEHLDFARIANDLRDEAARLAPDDAAANLVAALRVVIRETHRHLKVAYNFILPQVVKAAAPRPLVCEPW